MADTVRNDDEILRSFGYRPQLRRVLKNFTVFAFGFSAFSAVTAVFTSVGPIYAVAGPRGIWLIPVCFAGMFFVALIYANLATRVPVTGLEYQWGAKLANQTIGNALGWAGFTAEIVGVVAIDYVLASVIVPAVFNFSSTLTSSWLVTALALAIQTVILCLSITLVGRLTRVAAIMELGILVGGAILLIVVGALRGQLHPALLGSTGTVGGNGYWSLGNLSGVGPFWFGISVAFFATAGFQACGNVAEESNDPVVSVPRNIVRTLVIGVASMMALIVALVVTSSDVKALESSPLTVSIILDQVLGGAVGRVLLVLIAYSVFICGLGVYLQGVRYVWAMARDGDFPGYRLLRLRDVSPTLKTPVPATVAMLVVMEVVLAFFAERTAAFNNLLAAGGLSFVVIYALGLGVYAFRGRRLPQLAPLFVFGRWEWLVVGLAGAWLALSVWVFRLPAFNGPWIYLGVMYGIGAVYFVYRAVSRRTEAGVGAEQSGAVQGEEGDRLA